MLYASIKAWLNISQLSRVCVGVNKFAWGDPFKNSYDIYLINIYIIKWIYNFISTDVGRWKLICPGYFG